MPQLPLTQTDRDAALAGLALLTNAIHSALVVDGAGAEWIGPTGNLGNVHFAPLPFTSADVEAVTAQVEDAIRNKNRAEQGANAALAVLKALGGLLPMLLP